MIRLLAFVATLLLASAAHAASCTNGVNCPCDCLKQPSPSGDCLARYPGTGSTTNANVKLCEDWQASDLLPANQRGSSNFCAPSNGTGVGFTCHKPPIGSNSAIGSVNSNCLVNHHDGSGAHNDEVDGTCATCCYNGIASNASCEAPGESACLYDGMQVMGARMPMSVPTSDGGGQLTFTAGSGTIGITYAVKYSSNYVLSGPANKGNQFYGPGTKGAFPLGDSANNIEQNPPFDVDFQYTATCPAASSGKCDGSSGNVGASCTANSGCTGGGHCNTDLATGFGRCSAVGNGTIRLNANHGAWTFPVDTWIVERAKVEGLGTNNGRYRLWMATWGTTETLMVDTGTGMDFSNTDATWTYILLNHYYNGPANLGQTTGQTMYRYEGPLVVTSGDPVAASVIGFSEAGGPPPQPPPDTGSPVNLLCTPP